MTNFEKIKAMSVEEMARWFAGITSTECIYCYKIFCSGKSCKQCIKERLIETDETICPNCGKKVEEDG